MSRSGKRLGPTKRVTGPQDEVHLASPEKSSLGGPADRRHDQQLRSLERGATVTIPIPVGCLLRVSAGSATVLGSVVVRSPFGWVERRRLCRRMAARVGTGPFRIDATDCIVVHGMPIDNRREVARAVELEPLEPGPRRQPGSMVDEVQHRASGGALARVVATTLEDQAGVVLEEDHEALERPLVRSADLEGKVVLEAEGSFSVDDALLERRSHLREQEHLDLDTGGRRPKAGHRDVARLVGQPVTGTQPTAHEDARDRRSHVDPLVREVVNGVVQAGREEQDRSVGERTATAYRGSGRRTNPGKQASYIGSGRRLGPPDGKKEPAGVMGIERAEQGRRNARQRLTGFL
jgi:hypothetical protein